MKTSIVNRIVMCVVLSLTALGLMTSSARAQLTASAGMRDWITVQNFGTATDPSDRGMAIFPRSNLTIAATVHEIGQWAAGTYHEGLILAAFSPSGRLISSLSPTFTNSFVFVRDVEQTVNGDYCVIGMTFAGGNFTSQLVLLSGSGQELAVTQSGQAYDWYKADPTSDGGCIAAGYDYTSQPTQALLSKFDSSGAAQWHMSYPGAGGGDAFFWDVQQTSDGGYIAVGDEHLPSGSQQVNLRKVNAAGTSQWLQIPTLSAVFSVRQTSNGGYILAGVNNMGTTTFPRTDSSGLPVWQYTMPIFTNSDTGVAYERSNGDFVVVGNRTTATSLQTEIFVRKLSAAGAFLTEKIISRHLANRPSAARDNAQGAAVLIGSTGKFNPTTFDTVDDTIVMQLGSF